MSLSLSGRPRADVLHLGTAVTVRCQSHREANPSSWNPLISTLRNTVSHLSHQPLRSCAKFLGSRALAVQDAVLLSLVAPRPVSPVAIYLFNIYEWCRLRFPNSFSITNCLKSLGRCPTLEFRQCTGRALWVGKRTISCIRTDFRCGAPI